MFVWEIPLKNDNETAISIAVQKTGTSLASTLEKPLHEVTNEDFIAAIFSGVPENASPLVCSKRGDPETGGWSPMPASQVQAMCLDGNNNYVNCSRFHPEPDGSWKARKDNVTGFDFVLLDDVGTKVARERLNGFKVSWAIETSPGNFQVGIILAQPLTNADEITRLQDAVIAAGLCDPGATGATRWARLPKAINGKEKHKSADGQPFQVRLVTWRPGARYTIAEIISGLRLEMAGVKTTVQAVAKDYPVAHTGYTAPGKEASPADVAKLPALLAAIDPDCARPEWLRVLMAVFHTTGGSDEGFALVDAWSCKGKKYKGAKEIKIQWRSLNGNVQRPVTIGTLIMMARDAGADVQTIARGDNDVLGSCETIVIGANTQDPSSTATAVRQPGTANPLTRYSLRDSLVELEKQKVEQVLIFGSVVLLGQATVIYALANTGKTLILLYLIIEAIKKKLIAPTKLIYINMDDNSSGLVDKVRLALEYGFHMAADGHKGFQAKAFRAAMENMITENTARGVIVVLDTLKKFVNTMNKDESREFTRVVRQFCLKGGTVIALSHANKNPGANGKVKYTGTTDIVDDFDCAYTLETVSEQADTNQKVVEFTNIKRRGDVALTTAYSYGIERGLSYDELLLSVQEVNPDQLEPIKQAAGLQSDAPVIAAVEACIAAGINTKMLMVDAASKSANVSNRIVLKIIEKYTGEDTQLHRWKFVVRARGAQVFELLNRAASTPTGLLNVAEPIKLAAHRNQVNDATVLTDEAKFHMDILQEAMESYGGGYTDPSLTVQDEF